MNNFFQTLIKFSSKPLQRPFLLRCQIHPFATFKEKMEQRNMKKSVEEFKKEIEFMANKPSYTLADYRQRVIDGLNKLQKGLRAKLLTGTEQNEAHLIGQRKILNAFTDEELLNEKSVTSDSKKEIAVVSTTSVADVNMLLKNFEYMKGIHTWLKALKERNEPLPENEEDLSYMFRRDRPIKKSDFLKGYREPTWSKKKLRQRIKWGPRKRL